MGQKANSAHSREIEREDRVKNNDCLLANLHWMYLVLFFGKPYYRPIASTSGCHDTTAIGTLMMRRDNMVGSMFHSSCFSCMDILRIR